MADQKDFTPQEYESIIEELMNENEALKKRIAELEGKYKVVETLEEPIKEEPMPMIEPETEEPLILIQEPTKEVEIKPLEPVGEKIVSENIFTPEVEPLDMAKGGIIQGTSRRECPKCGNSNKMLIRETIDRTHIICDYPRMYGKKYHCGECGVEWRVPVEM
ncbi:MAG: hypothetical protein ACFFCV_09360 [Promethearchaeota archaeon]